MLKTYYKHDHVLIDFSLAFCRSWAPTSYQKLSKSNLSILSGLSNDLPESPKFKPTFSEFHLSNNESLNESIPKINVDELSEVGNEIKNKDIYYQTLINRVKIMCEYIKLEISKNYKFLKT